MIKVYFKSLIIIALFLGLNINSKAQNALNFDGVDDFVVTGYNGVLGTGARTIEAWIKTTANANPSAGGSQKVIVDYGNFITGGRFTFCVLWANAIRIEVGGSGLSGTIPVNDGQWHHVAAVYNPSVTNKYSLYVDGVLDVAGNITTTLNTVQYSTVVIGRRIDGINLFDGSIDEVRIYDYAKPLSLIISDTIHELCSPPANLVSYFKFNEGIAGGTNTGNITAYGSVGNQTGTLYGFSLSGSTSNWILGKNLLVSTFNSITASNCQYYLSPAGKTYTTTGIYHDTLTNSIGCDSIITINLTIGGSTSSVTETACKSYLSPSGKIYTSSGIYKDTLVNGNSQGCDSIITINLTIDTLNTNVSKLNETLTASELGASFQWLNCDLNFAIISGETDSAFTATQNGNYAVEISKNNCIDTSDCYLINSTSIEENADYQWSVSPIPVIEYLEINFNELLQDIQLEIYSMDGKRVYKKFYSSSSKLKIDFDFPAGVYFIKINTSKVNLSRKILKK